MTSGRGFIPSIAGVLFLVIVLTLSGCDNSLSTLDTTGMTDDVSVEVEESEKENLEREKAERREAQRERVENQKAAEAEQQREREESQKAAEAEQQRASEEQEAANLKTEVESVAGQSYEVVYPKLSELGFSMTWLHQVTLQDFTESVRLSIENPDPQFDLPWIVMGVESVNTDSKSVTLLIDTQENMDRMAADAAMNDALASKLDLFDAKLAVAEYGKSAFPYGFKLHYYMGVLAETAEDENTWFLKITCDITNEYGAKMKDRTCEARVTGTTENPQVIDFFVY